MSSFADEEDQNKDVLWCERVREKENNEIAHPRLAANKENDSVKTSSNKQMRKVYKVGSVTKAVNSSIEKTPEFLAHIFIKRQQTDCFQQKLEDIPKRSAVIQVNFSDNHAFKQGEIESTNWRQQQLKLLTVCVQKHDGKKSIVFVSNDMDHDKITILVFLHKLLADLHQRMQSLNFHLKNINLKLIFFRWKP